jgi:polysaccharide deacetylase 2 family uncharacterized protein YibQ
LGRIRVFVHHRAVLRFLKIIQNSGTVSLLIFVLAFAIFFAGCKRKAPSQLTPDQVHSITRELAAAARNAIPRSAEVKAEFGLANGARDAGDQLTVKIPGSRDVQEGRRITATLLQALNAVGTRHGLVEQSSENREGMLLVYLRAGVATHAIHIQFSGDTVATFPGMNKKGTPRLAIILDDLGSDRAVADIIFGIRYPLTISILPNHEHSVEIAEAAHDRGYQVMLHLPMQSVGQETSEAKELRPGMSEEEVRSLVSPLLRSFPYIAGVNNHQGSQATANPALMQALMPLLRENHLFYIDSRTTAATVAYDTARAAGVHCAFRNVPFLDDVQEESAIRRQLELAIRDAKKTGEAVVIGHPHAVTLRVLRTALPHLAEQGVRLVPASDLVH